jgi:type IV pilus assembly protein PilQ
MTPSRCIARVAVVALFGAAAFAAPAPCQDEARPRGDERPPGDAPKMAAEPAPPAPVTLSAHEIEVKELLSMLSGSRGVNIVCSGGVSGTVSIELHDVPFEEALRAVAAAAGLEVVRRDGLYFVRPSATGDPADDMIRDARTFRLDYARSDDVLAVVQNMISATGKVMSYPPLRALVVEDRPDVLARIAETIDSIDVPPRQVMIEAQILEARLSRDSRYGIDWSLIFSSGDGSGDVVVEGFASPAAAGTEGLFVTWGQGDFAGAIEALQNVEELRTLAAPRVLAVDGSQAEIIIGGQLGFSVVTTVENTVIQSVEFLDTGAQLRITPIITGDGHVLMRVNPELSDGVIEEGLPSKTTTQVTSDVLLKDGHTLLIGGLIREREEKTRSGIPILSRIPILGGLFGQTTTGVQRSEVIALITPRIVAPGESPPYDGIGLVETSKLPPGANAPATPDTTTSTGTMNSR